MSYELEYVQTPVFEFIRHTDVFEFNHFSSRKEQVATAVDDRPDRAWAQPDSGRLYECALQKDDRQSFAARSRKIIKLRVG